MTQINTILWLIATFLLVVCGLYYSFKLRFPQFHFSHVIPPNFTVR